MRKIIVFPTFWISIYTWGYLIFLGIGLLSYLNLHDSYWWLTILHSLTFYWFLPLFTIIPIAYFTRRGTLALFASIALVLFLVFYGGLFLSRPQSDPPTGPTLKVMTYNVMEVNSNTAWIGQTVVESGADVVGFQELQPTIANTIHGSLSELHPYQTSDGQGAESSESGNSLISRYPIQLLEDALPGPWHSPSLVCIMEFNEETILVINLHAVQSKIGSLDPAAISRATQIREQQARNLVAFAAETNLPLIVMGDFNTTDKNKDYRIITRTLKDAWREAGWGFGHTFGLRLHTFGTDRPFGLAFLLPRWLLRIDYVFYSPQWKVSDVRLGKWDQVSDHRPVITTLELQTR